MDAAQDIKAKLSIEDVVGEYVRLKRAGRNFKGLSPFTPEKTPSFVINDNFQNDQVQYQYHKSSYR